MSIQLKTTWLAIAGAVVLAVAGCFRASPVASAPEPLAVPTKTPPWAESYGRFYTKDVARAQQQIPFPIILPKYVPATTSPMPMPNIEGPLREYQHDGRVHIDVFYVLNPGEKVVRIIEIGESNYPVLPPPPELNPGYVHTEIRGKKMVKSEGNFAQGRGVVYYFNRDSVYLVLGVYNLALEEALKIVESMLE